jgi:hypothetical protein
VGPSVLAGIGDVIALTELERHLRSIRLRDYAVCYSHLAVDDQPNSNLVLIGGSSSNRVSLMTMERLPLTFVFNENDVQILDRANGEFHGPIERKEGALTTDFGLIIRVLNPFNNEQKRMSPRSQLLGSSES